MNSASTNAVRAVAGAALAGVCAIAVAGCGNDVPSNAVARVGDTVITKGQFDHWFESAAAGQQQAGGPAAVPDPDDEFRACIAALREAQPEDAEEQEDAALRRQCRQSYDQLKQQVMQFLIQSQWVLQESEEQGVEVGDREVRTLFDDQKQQAFPRERDYREFLRSSGSTEQDILFRVKLDALQTKLMEKIQEQQEEITREDVEAYYEENQERFAQPERRDLRVVLTRNKANADRAKRELEQGASFAEVAERHSIDEASKENGGRLPDVAQGQQDPALDEAVFGAERGELQGPVEAQFGWYVFRVTGVTEGSRQSLDDARETIRGLLRSEREQETLQSFIEDFREDFKGITKCREEFVVAECSNAPEEETETGPDGAPAPQQGAPPPQQGAPPPQQQAPPPAGQ